jgi:D-alanyl-D-alanine carboxypeptidase
MTGMSSIVVRRVPILLSSLILIASLPVVATAQSPDSASASATVAPPTLEAALAVLDAEGSGLMQGDETGLAMIEPAKVRLPACKIEDTRTRFGAVRHWKKTLLDTNLKVGRRYRPPGLVSVSKANIKGSGLVRKVMIRDLRALAAAARSAGKPLAVRSAYRSYDYQRRLFDSYVRQYGFAKAATFSARPGHSEHQLGTTVDFTTAPSVPLTTRFGDSPSGKWIAKHGWKYGFIMSYPKAKKSASCYSYEPWHWRYFGRDQARKIHESGQVPRRFLYEHYESQP